MRVIAGEARGRRLEALPGTDVTQKPGAAVWRRCPVRM